ncbi:MAG: hypothetical protein SFV17_15630 [Candidatus Obscuribacter sp.]|nr:hypothetical protein [Candidatus Melainabacteria bacterium]MDX1988114.1 hypothetical protein [Candidatus Obscuribacter sp.]
MHSSNSTKQLLVIFGSLAIFLGSTGLGYYWGFTSTWNHFKKQPLIGKEPITLQLVKVVRDIPASGKVEFENVEEVRVKMPQVYADSLGFASECMGRQVKWTLRKGGYVSRHDLVPIGKADSNLRSARNGESEPKVGGVR